MAQASRSPHDQHEVHGGALPGGFRSCTILVARAGGPEMVVQQAGDGIPVVFLHGLLGLNEHWMPIARRLAEFSRPVLFETPLLKLRGQQRSVEGVTSIILSAMDEFVREPAVLVGSSFGGHVALHIALDHPERVAGLVLAGSSGLFEIPYEEEIEQRLTKEVQIRPSKEWLRLKLGELFYDKGRIPEGVLDRAFNELADPRGARAMVKLSKSAKRDHLGSRLSEILAPTCVLWGREDLVTPTRVAEEFKAGIPGAYIHWIEECGHALMIEKPEEFTDGLTLFLDRFMKDREGSVAPGQGVA